jgi:glutamine synthetase
VNPYLASAIIIQAGLAGVRNKEQLPPPLDINSRFLTEDRSAYLDTLPLSIEDAIECASNSDFINKSKFKDIDFICISKEKPPFSSTTDSL